VKLQHVTGKLCFVRCCKCGESTAIGDFADRYQNSPGMADLHGEPFKAYYCPNCAHQAQIIHDMREAS
jgi:ribosomal protein S26